ncbi:DNA-processing protein DprA [Methylovorus glucosotrophus]|uniref:DNA protecting protein DprA n=1 Tax=Methylovorus glucosotrophus (strain SIP3-4) TaxID=582744 RepID=C6X8G1_METGS|nr:DNA-processing protein DprA [Methylovorus glucosotrophus]ACT49431.1 DNA protecting protein DprA [Methylovorus glucosotrophus SIP3-4]
MSLSASDLEEARLWIALSLVPGLGGQRICQLLKVFGSPEQIFAAPHDALRQVVPEPVAEAITAGPDLAATDFAANWLMQENNHLLTLADSRYPPALLEIADPPPLLYAKGQLPAFDLPGMAIVGSRNATPQGEKNAADFAQALCEQGYCVISGLALGIDGAAHQGALRAKGITIAVVGTGLDIVYPSKHRALAHQIVEQGLIISEFALGTPSRPQNFPRRNRLISGLSQGCLVVEANAKSGSLITARLAAEQGREVFAIPGSIHSPVSKGCHELIKQGAKLVDCIQDIVQEMAPLHSQQQQASQEDAFEGHDPEETPHTQLLACMGYDPISIDALQQSSGLTSDSLSAMLLVLELENKVVALPGGRYQRMS